MTSPFRLEPPLHASPPRPREAEILAAARHVFADKGFDGASMQDLARAVGMSVGNFYRYFPSKAAMVAAMIRRDLDEAEQQFALLTRAPEPLATLRAVLHDRIRSPRHCEDGPLWAEITAAALRKPDLAEVVARMEADVVGYLERAFALATGLAPAQVAARFAGHARLMILLMRSTVIDAGLYRGPNTALTDLVLRQIDTLLDEIAAARLKDFAK